MRFRQNRVGIVGDIKKMYNSVKISEFDMHTHRFIQRDLDVEKIPHHYMLKTVTFRDKPGGAIAMMVLRKTAQMNLEYPLATKMVIEDSYVDDVLESFDNAEIAVERMRQVEEVLETGGFEMKQWVMFGNNRCLNEKMLNTNHEKVLGSDWKPKEDRFSFKIK